MTSFGGDQFQAQAPRWGLANTQRVTLPAFLELRRHRPWPSLFCTFIHDSIHPNEARTHAFFGGLVGRVLGCGAATEVRKRNLGLILLRDLGQLLPWILHMILTPSRFS